MKNLHVIGSEHDYEGALQRIEEIFNAPKDSPESHELQILVLLVKKYETEKILKKYHYLIP